MLRVFVIFVTTRNSQETWMRLEPYRRATPQETFTLSVSSPVSWDTKQAGQTKVVVISILHASSRSVCRWRHLPKFTITGSRNRQWISWNLAQLFNYMNVLPPVRKDSPPSHSLQQFMKQKCIQKDFFLGFPLSSISFCCSHIACSNKQQFKFISQQEQKTTTGPGSTTF